MKIFLRLLSATPKEEMRGREDSSEGRVKEWVETVVNQIKVGLSDIQQQFFLKFSVSIITFLHPDRQSALDEYGAEKLRIRW